MSVQSHHAFEAFENVYDERDTEANKWKENGGKIVGCLGSDVPEELLIAFGFLPVRIFGSPNVHSALAEDYLENGFDPLIRAQFTRIIDGSYQYLDHLIISNSSDAVIRVYYYLRALNHMENELHVPDLYFFDFLHTRFRISALYNRHRTEELISELENWSGRSLNESELRRSINVCNENRKLLQKLSTFRHAENVRVSGSQALKIIGSSMLMEKEKHNGLLSSLLERVEEFPAFSGIKIFVTGSMQDHSEFYELVESCGAVIVGEDHDFGLRHYIGEVDTSADLIDGIVDRYHMRYLPSSQSTVTERVKTLIENVTAVGSEGVIFFIHQADDAPSWDYPEQMKALRELGIPSLLIDRQSYILNDKDNIRRKITEFIDFIQHREIVLEK